MAMSNNLKNILKKFIFLFILSIFSASLSFADVMEFEFGTYSGESFFGQPHGRGEFAWNEGDSFSGQWVHGSREGRGKQIFEDGSILVGMYKDDLPNGKGKFTFTNGNVYVGNFKDGLFDGKGTLTYADTGGVFAGEFKKDKRTGEGTMTLADGTTLTGMYVNDAGEGVHIATYEDGTTEELLLKNGELVE